MPIFAPPDDLSPAAMRYVRKMGADNRAFAAALVDMGVRGHIRMVEERRRLVLKQQDPDRAARCVERRFRGRKSRAATSFVQPGESIVMEQKNHDEFLFCEE